MFNVLYAEAVVRLKCRLKQRGLNLRLRIPKSPFSDEAAGEDSTELLEVIYVDDLAAIIFARSPAVLRDALETFAETLIEVFAPLGLSINWRPGETKIMVCFRGTHMPRKSCSACVWQISDPAF